ncbi:hypothetical protein DAI22_03g044501 [Oryza sativa Japonica Group]|nr:hypothetical protein DAI22_03g044501 [Oryza sativa Japonica Group]
MVWHGVTLQRSGPLKINPRVHCAGPPAGLSFHPALLRFLPEHAARESPRTTTAATWKGAGATARKGVVAAGLRWGRRARASRSPRWPCRREQRSATRPALVRWWLRLEAAEPVQAVVVICSRGEPASFFFCNLQLGAWRRGRPGGRAAPAGYLHKHQPMDIKQLLFAAS